MKGFIEVKSEGNIKKYLISVASIKYVCPENDIVHIALKCIGGKKSFAPWIGLCIESTESYSEILEKIKNAIE